MNHKFLPSRILGPAAGVCSMARSPLRGASGQDWSLRASKSNGLIALLIVLAFVGSRAALLVTSYDVNQNWEEPVFLFSATELQRDGIRNIFDHQDDLNHGGSVVVLLLAVPWVSAVGRSMVALKGVAIIWSTLTLCAYLLVAWRYFSPRAALLWGVLYLALSPTAARLNVTLVGSHPEALLPCALALAAYLEWVRRGADPEQQGLTFALGWTCGAALWVAYMSAMFVVPLLVLRLAYVRRPRTLGVSVAGLLFGLWPWVYQDLWLRPQGAMLWMRNLAAPHAAAGALQRWRDTATELVTSFGYADAGGAVMLTLCTLALLALIVGVAVPAWRARWPWTPLTIVPLLIAPVLGFLMVANTSHPYHAIEGYYYFRFFIPLQMSLLLVFAVVSDAAAGSNSRLVFGAALVALAVGVWTQVPLYAQGNHYRADFERDRSAGCHVYGAAEWDRAPDAAAAVRRLAGLSGAACQDSALKGFGWGVAGRFLKDGNVAEAIATLDSIADPRLRWAACGGVLFAVERAPEADVTAEQRSAALPRIAAYCRTLRPG